MGIANVDSAARVCHAPSTSALKETIGAAATTCSFDDVLESDLIVLIGSNPATNAQPVFMKYLYEAKRNGTKVVVVNPYLEPGLERYWVPSSLESALFGTKICDLHVPVPPGGDVAFANAVLKELMASGAIDKQFIDEKTTGFDEVATALAEEVARTSCWSSLGPREPIRFASSTSTAGALRGGPGLVDGHHPAATRSTA